MAHLSTAPVQRFSSYSGNAPMAGAVDQRQGHRRTTASRPSPAAGAQLTRRVPELPTWPRVSGVRTRASSAGPSSRRHSASVPLLTRRHVCRIIARIYARTCRRSCLSGRGSREAARYKDSSSSGALRCRTCDTVRACKNTGTRVMRLAEVHWEMHTRQVHSSPGWTASCGLRRVAQRWLWRT